MSGKEEYPAFKNLIRNTLGQDFAQQNEAGMSFRPPTRISQNPGLTLQQSQPNTPSFNFSGRASSQGQGAASSQGQGAAFGPPRRSSIFDRTPSEIAFEESLEIIIEDDSKPPGTIDKWLPNYFVPSWIKHRDAERKKIPFSVLIMSKEKKELRDLDELWDDYNTVVDPVTKTLKYNPRGYFAALLDGDMKMISLIEQKCGLGIEAYRNVLKCLLLYNLKRIHKIVQWDDEPNTPGIPVYDSSPNRIFRNINIQKIFDCGTLNQHEQEFVNIMNEEAYSLYSLSSNTNINANSSPFVDMNEYDQHRNDAFFTLANSNFRIFLNRVTIRYWKSLRYHKKY